MREKRAVVKPTPEQMRLVTDNLGLIYAYVHRQFSGLNMDKRRELIEDGKLAMLSTVSRYDPSIGSYSNYVYNVLHFSLMNQYYKMKKHFTVLDFDENRAGKNDELYWEDFDFEEKENLAKAMAELPQQQRDVINYLYVDQYTAREIAEKLDLKKEKDVYRLRRRALKSLRQTLGVKIEKEQDDETN